MPSPKRGLQKPTAPKRGERLKTGCYTCRLRRKKCDQATSTSSDRSKECNNCERLHIQCLGFGQKRPDWLKANQAGIVRKIKEHCGTAKNRTSPTTFLRLLDDSEDDDSFSSSSPPSSHDLFNSRGSSYDAPGDNYTANFATTAPLLTRQDDDLDEDYSGYSNFVQDRPDMALELQPLGVPTQFDGLSLVSDVELDPSSVQTTWYLDPNWSSMLPNNMNPYTGLSPHISLRRPDLVEQYTTEVAPKQWLLVDPAAISGLLQAITANSGNGISRQAAMLLVQVHNNLTHNDQDVESLAKYNDIKQKTSVGTVKYPTGDKAWCALMLISVFLFLGGNGEWDYWLGHACDYVVAALGDFHPRDRLRSLGNQEQFLVKASIWFDVVAAVSTGQAARLQSICQRLFTPPVIRAPGPAFHTSSELSMLEVMGCDSHVVLALSNALGLAAWKEQQVLDGTLSVHELVIRAAKIEESVHKEAKPLTATDELSVKRYFCSEMYRTSTRLFLRSIVSGDFPGVKDIQDGVADVMTVWLQARHKESLLSLSITSAIVRMALFAFAICGALTDKEEVFRDITVILDAQGIVGNSASLSTLLKGLWSTPRKQDTPVRWREALKKQNLLLV